VAAGVPPREHSVDRRRIRGPVHRDVRTPRFFARFGTHEVRLRKMKRVSAHHDRASPNGRENSPIQFLIDRAPVEIKLRTSEIVPHDRMVLVPVTVDFDWSGAKKRPRRRPRLNFTGAAGRHADSWPSARLEKSWRFANCRGLPSSTRSVETRFQGGLHRWPNRYGPNTTRAGRRRPRDTG
jgi:hypothetical protein